MIWYHDGIFTGRSPVYESQDLTSTSLLKILSWHSISIQINLPVLLRLKMYYILFGLFILYFAK